MIERPTTNGLLHTLLSPRCLISLAFINRTQQLPIGLSVRRYGHRYDLWRAGCGLQAGYH